MTFLQCMVESAQGVRVLHGERRGEPASSVSCQLRLSANGLPFGGERNCCCQYALLRRRMSLLQRGRQADDGGAAPIIRLELGLERAIRHPR